VTRRPRLSVAPDEPDQVVRRKVLEAKYPQVSTGYDRDHDCWRGVIREPGGETVTVRYSLKELLDRLEELLGDPGLAGDRRRCLPRRAPVSRVVTRALITG
jgi:hypothetical protein